MIAMPEFGGAGSEMIPEHELIRPIGRGAYGEVWLARSSLGASRAVKIIRRDGAMHSADFEREVRGWCRFEPASRSHHGLVTILQAGHLDRGNRFYCVMELADDTGGRESYLPRTLRTDLASHGSLPAGQVACLGIALAHALDHLHRCGLVHRDIKPGNIVMVRGLPKLADAGLVTTIGEARSMVGTAGYIPPEGPGTTAADIYALGKVLYESAFGLSPNEFPRMPAQAGRSAEHAELLELNEVLLKACDTNPKRRHMSPLALAEELEFVRAGRSLRSRRRRRWALQAGCGAILLAGALAVSLLWVNTRRNDTGAARGTAHAEAWTEYRLGQFHWNKRRPGSPEKARSHFRRAAELDPDFGLAWAGLANSAISPGGHRGSEHHERLEHDARHAVQRALALAPRRAETWLAVGHAAWRYDFDGPTAEAAFARAESLAPDLPLVHVWSALYHHLPQARFASAVSAAERAVALDPTSHAAVQALGICRFHARDFRAAAETFDQASQLEGEWTQPHLFRAASLVLLGDAQAALTVMDGLRRSASNPPPLVVAEEVWIRAAAGEWRHSASLADQLLRSSTTTPFARALVAVALGQTGDAIEELRRAAAQRDTLVTWLGVDPHFDALRHDARFAALLRELRLPAHVHSILALKKPAGPVTDTSNSAAPAASVRL
jgi:serine/threonine protein kinase/Tfp pilus assembly protein PilF